MILQGRDSIVGPEQAVKRQHMLSQSSMLSQEYSLPIKISGTSCFLEMLHFTDLPDA